MLELNYPVVTGLNICDVSLAVFRMAFGLAMLAQVTLIYPKERIHFSFIFPKMMFHYFGFNWVRPWPGSGMYLHFAVLAVLSILVTVGLWYRVSIILLALGWTYVFLLDQSQYQNHYYLLCLVGFLLAFMPAHRTWSLDAYLRPARRCDTTPTWTLWLLRAQLGIVYFFGGVAKLNLDWLSGASMRCQLTTLRQSPVLGPYVDAPWMIMGFTWGGLLLDLLIVPLLLWRRTRLTVFALCVLFHLLNSHLFEIGVFPWFMLVATAIFFSPGWPRRFFSRMHAGGPLPPLPTPERRRGLQKGMLLVLGLYLMIQVLVPFRHLLHPGNVAWNRLGARFSWRMRLHHRAIDPPRVFVTLPDKGKSIEVHLIDFLTPDQYKGVAVRPDMLLQVAHFLDERFQARGHPPVEVYALVSLSLNGRGRQLLIDPQQNLAALPRTLGALPWVSDLTGPRRLPGADTATDSLVVLLHGIGASGDDLIGLADYWAGTLPNTAFYSPHAPHPYDDAPMGYQW